MREILFKARRVDNGEWVQGYLFVIWEQAYILRGTTNGVPNMVEVISGTVCQYTGLNDKNGVKIFEGDILNEDGEPFTVAYDTNRAKFKLQYTHAIQYPEWNRGILMEVIGNIYDNDSSRKEMGK